MLKKVLVVAGAVAAMSLAGVPAHADVTNGSGGVLSGNQISIPIIAPVNVCGNGIAVVGLAIAGCEGGAQAFLGPRR
ncbi:Small secreted domain [Nonomuraea maritima]|uniref:Small secreted domain n=1 Tax=Nonomuraea maritima TaxID=683260 RepID=A0A1G9E7W6_9ACTN|nr:chaplin [Nonomuraea maritima]SDK72210.1 Small secreted domain [Nonomuraea maritima]